jgi:hypothetical protein
MFFYISKLEFRNTLNNDYKNIFSVKVNEFIFRVKLTSEQSKEIHSYLEYLTPEMILFGLRFAYSRNIAIAGGYLMPGRKSIVKLETHMLSYDQARWRLKNWKSMIRNYKQKGYSYPTISRIKKEVRKIIASREI